MGKFRRSAGFLAMLLGTLLITASPRLAMADSVKDGLDHARDVYDAAMAKATADLTTAFNAQIKTVSQTGDLDAVEQLRSERSAFVSSKTVPTASAMRAAVPDYEQTTTSAAASLRVTYQNAVSDYTKAGRFDDAEAIKQEMDRRSVSRSLPASEPTTNESVPITDTGQAKSDSYPPIGGAWREAPGVMVVITQSNGDFTAQCSYIRPGFGEVRWEMKGTIAHDGTIKATLHHTLAPRNFKVLQICEGRLSVDGNTIAGTAIWEGGGQEFTWARAEASKR